MDRSPFLISFLSESRVLPCFTTDRAGTISHCSPAAISCLRLSADRLLGHPLWCLLVEPDATLLRRQLREGEAPRRAPLPLTFRDAEGHTVTLTCVLEAHADGFVLVGEATAGGEATAEALRQSESRFHTLLEASPIGISITDAAGHYETVNQAYCSILGYTRDELMGRQFTLVYAADLNAEMLRKHDELVAHGKPYRGFHDMLRADGHTVTVLINSAPVPGPDGQQKCATFIMDVTAQERMSAALRVSQARLRAVIEYAPIVLFALDQHGVVTFYEGGALAAHGISPGPVVGQSVLSWLVEWPHLREQVRRALAGEAFSTIIEMSNMVFEVCWTPEHDAAGEVTGGTGLAVDVTETVYAKRDAERAHAAAVELAQLRSDFVMSISHELRTPLTSFIGYGEILQAHWDQLDDAQRRDRLARMVLAANRQKRLVEDLLSLSRLDSNLPTPRRIPLNVAGLVQRVASEVKGSYPGQHIELEGPGDMHALGDPDRTAQILANVIDNAAKYSVEGSPVAITWCLEEGVVLVRVRDSGCGLPEVHRARLFTRFGRIPGSPIRAGRVGAGLGLYLGREYARAMGGDLDLEETGPTGSTFRLRLPANLG